MDVQRICSTVNCGKPATLQCPSCIKLNLKPSFFCSESCFKEFWPIHKLFHKKDSNANLDSKFKGFPFTGPLRPGKVSPKLFVPDSIKKPDYAYTGIPKEEQQRRSEKFIEVKTAEEIEKMRQSCLLGRETLDFAHSLVKPGITTDEIDAKTHQFIIERNAYPSPLNYVNFPKSLCTSVNEVVCHGIPDDRKLESNDIINLDISVYFKGMHSDLNETYCVGENVPESSKFLIEKTYNCLTKAIEICKPGTMYKEVGNVIEKHAKEHGLSVVRTYTGHGVGSLFHTSPNVPHYAKNKTPGFMKAGHIFTIEPMINQGTYEDLTWPDDWTAVTKDGQRSAQFEHTLLITESGVEVLTARNSNSPPLHFPC